jgi:hypothetical protein
MDGPILVGEEGGELQHPLTPLTYKKSEINLS